MEVIKLEKISKRFFLQQEKTFKEFLPAFFRGGAWAKPLWALKNVSFSVKKGETLGIIGRNGSGKSTTLKLIAGVMSPTEGKITVRGRVSPLIELGAGFHPELTGRENVYLNGSILGMKRAEIDKKFKSIVNFSELQEFIDSPVKRYSSGMYMRLGFSIAVHVDPEILLVDEVFAVGDIAFQEKCLKKMQELKNKGVTIVFVSHSMEAIRQHCDRAFLLEDGKIIKIGNTEQVIYEYTKQI